MSSEYRNPIHGLLSDPRCCWHHIAIPHWIPQLQWSTLNVEVYYIVSLCQRVHRGFTVYTGGGFSMHTALLVNSYKDNPMTSEVDD